MRQRSGSSVRGVRLSYSLLQCKVFTYEPGVPWRLSNVFSEEATKDPWVSPGLWYWPHFFFFSVEAASIGFIIVIDRRRDKWSSIKASLTRIAVNIYFCAFLYKEFKFLFSYFISKSQGKGDYFMLNFGKVFVAEAVVSHLYPLCHLKVTAENSWACQRLPESLYFIDFSGHWKGAGRECWEVNVADVTCSYGVMGVGR